MRTNLYKPQNCGSGPQPHTGAAPRRHRLKRLCALAIAFLCGMQWAWAYNFAVTSGGNTYYFNITDATNKYVEVTYPNSNNVSWTGYTKPTGTLNIPGIVTYNGTSYTVTGIGNAAFAGCTDITYVGIPTTITSMDSHAFRNCTGITTVAIYSNAVMSENYTSSYNLTKIFGSQVTKYAIGNTVTAIGYCAFYGCTSLETVTIANSVSSIGSSAFEGCTSLGSVVLPNSLTTISNAMFKGCTNLASVTIPSSVTSVKDFAFENCTALNRINITDLAAWCGIEYETFGLPFPQSYDLYLNNTKVTNLTIPSGQTTIKAKTFAGCSSITSVTIPSSVTSVGSYAFSSCNNLNRVNISDLAAWCGITFPDAEANPLSQAHNLYLNNTKITNLSIPSGVSAIKAYVFYGGTGFTSAYIANSVATIGTSAFQGCSNMTQVTFTRESSATTFGTDAFRGCTGLTKVYIPGTEFMCRANFSNAEANPLTYAHHLYLSGQTSEITTLDIYNIVSSIGPYAFSGGTGITAVSSVNPGYSVTSIGSGAFRGCTGLASMPLTNSLTSIGSYAFEGCTSLASVTIPSSVTTLGNQAFSGCTNLTSVTLNSNTVASATYTSSNNFKTIFGSQVQTYAFGTDVTGIGANAMRGCSEITSVTMPNVTTIGNYAFRGCTGITSVTMPNVTTIGNYAFDGCSGITSATMPNVTTIGYYAFDGCTGITSATMPKVSSIGKNAFDGCTGMTEVTFGGTANKNINENAFLDCTGLEKVTIIDDDWDFAIWCSTTFANAEANPLTYAHHLYRGDTEIKDLVFPVTNVTTIKPYAFSGGSGFETVTIPYGVSSIGANAFLGCSGITEVTIPSTINTIGNYAFDGCTDLTSVTIEGDAVASISYLRTKFGNQVTSYTIGANVTAIGDYAFYNCTGITELHVNATTPPTIASANTFYGVDKTIPVYVPEGTMATYKAARYWSAFFASMPLPSNLQYTFVSPTQMQFSWTRNPGQTHISIDFADNDAFVGANRINSSDTEFTVNFSTPLLPNTTYYIRAKAIYDGQNSGLVSEFTEAVSFITPIDAYKPTNLAAVFVSATQVDLSWTNVAGFTGSGFQFSAQEDFSATLTPAITSTGPSSMSLTFSTPLEPSTTYYVRVMNQFNAVQGPWSEAFELTTPAACAAPTALAATNIGPFSATLSWTGDADEYNVEYRTVAATTEVNEGFANGIPSSWTNTGTGGGWSLNSGAIVSTIEAGVMHYNSISIPVTNKKGKLTFRAKKGSSNAAIYVYVSNDNTNFTQVGVISTGQLTASYKRFTVDLSDQAEEAGYIRLYHSQRLQSTNSTTVYVDDIVFESYQMGAWIPAGTTTENMMALTNLTCGGTYQFRVKAPCTTGFMSDWATSANFSTLYNIVFEDAAVKTLCVANWDANSDGELNYAEAAAVQSLGTVFYVNRTITKFNELQYFTGLQEIGDSAFDCCESLEEVTLPAQITKIGEKAFNVCERLTSIVIPEGVTELDDQAFRYAGLQSLVLPNTMQKINNRVFEDCRNLTAIHLPASVFYMGTNPFCSTGIETITVDPANTVFTSPAGSNAIISTYSNTNEVVLRVGCKNTVVPENVTEIKNHAFYGCEGLTSITLPASVTTIGTEAFRGCRALTSINLPASVTTIGDYAFRNCGLTSATLGQGVTTIGDYAFSGCISLTSLTVEATEPPTLGTDAFGQSTNLAAIDLNVPCEGLQAYKSHATWGQFNNVTECEYRFVNADFWYEPAGWLYGEVPGEGAAVSIEAYCILDTDVTVASINILNTGTLDIDACTLTVTNTITNSDADNLILNDGAQLKHNNSGVMARVYKSITGYGAANVNKSTGWRFISSPTVTTENRTNPASVTNLITDPVANYDLYSFAGWADLEWKNYKANTFDMYRGEGYLYARQDNANLIFTGKLEPSQWYVFDYLSSEGGFTEWQLMGNPFVCDAYITNGTSVLSYYVMNAAGDGYIPAEGAIAPGEGFFVHVPYGEGMEFSLTREAPTMQPATLNINLSSNAAATRGGQSDVIDRAIVHFGEGSTLEKLTFREGCTQLYIPMEGTDYAVVKAGTVGELPVSFKAEKNGAYTLGFTNAEVTFSYLRLIDNMTGTETDLLQQPSYSFDARTTDYASRFRLQFATGTSENAEGSTFGFVNASGNFTVFGIEGEATLQVIDVTGRVLSSETFSGSYERKLDVSPGVYLMRLINGADVKTQKIVIE